MNVLTGAESEKVNSAITQHVGLRFSTDKFYTSSEEYGFATACLVQEVYNFTVSLPINWSAETLQTAIANVATAVKKAYPQLNDESVRRLQSCLAYAWR